MARDYSQTKCARWEDDADWLALPVACQHIYDAISQDKRLSWCGVIPFAPAALAKRSADNTEAKVRKAVTTLVDRRFLVYDKDTNELLVRSYIRNGNAMSRRNFGIAVGRAIENVISEQIKDAVRAELQRLWREDHDLAGWAGLNIASPDEFAMASGMAWGMQYGME